MKGVTSTRPDVEQEMCTVEESPEGTVVEGRCHGGRGGVPVVQGVETFLEEVGKRTKGR